MHGDFLDVHIVNSKGIHDKKIKSKYRFALNNTQYSLL